MRNGLVAAIKNAVVRLYALGMMLLVLWTGYTAVIYLFRSVFWPTHVPTRFLAWRAALDAGTLRAKSARELVQEATRAPMSHYHHIDRWFQPDPHNGCTTSGCHSPLPHNERVELRAFANFHATFLTCQMCHLASTSSAAQAMWVSTITGRQQGTPAVLRLITRLERDAAAIDDEPAAISPNIARLLKAVINQAGGDPELEHLLLQIETAQPGSPLWKHAIAQLAAELPEHARGEYAAKLAPAMSSQQWENLSRELATEAREYLAAAPDSEHREQSFRVLHRSVAAEPDECLACHGGEPARLDYVALGYSPGRDAALRNSVIASQVQRIREAGSAR